MKNEFCPFNVLIWILNDNSYKFSNDRRNKIVDTYLENNGAHNERILEQLYNLGFGLIPVIDVTLWGNEENPFPVNDWIPHSSVQHLRHCYGDDTQDLTPRKAFKLLDDAIEKNKIKYLFKYL